MIDTIFHGIWTKVDREETAMQFDIAPEIVLSGGTSEDLIDDTIVKGQGVSSDISRGREIVLKISSTVSLFPPTRGIPEASV